MAAKRQRSNYPEATFKNLIGTTVNGTKFEEQKGLKLKWVEEFNTVEGADFLRRQDALNFNNEALKNLQKSLNGYRKNLDKLSNSPTAESVAEIYNKLSVVMPEGSLDERITYLTQLLKSKQSVTTNEAALMENLRNSYQAIEKEYLQARKGVYKTWRSDYS